QERRRERCGHVRPEVEDLESHRVFGEWLCRHVRPPRDDIELPTLLVPTDHGLLWMGIGMERVVLLLLELDRTERVLVGAEELDDAVLGLVVEDVVHALLVLAAALQWVVAIPANGARDRLDRRHRVA